MGRQSASSETVSQRKKDLAKGRMDNAFRLKIAGDTDGARASLADAVRTDPSLISDSAAVGLAQALTGLPRDQAILSLLQTSGDAQPIESSRPVFKFTTQQFDTFLYIFALFIVLLLFSGAMYVGIAQLVNIFMSRAELSPKLASQMNVLLDQIKPAELVRATLQTGVEWLFDILLGIGAIYMIGTMMGGVGAIGAFTRKMARAYIILYVLLSVGLLLLIRIVVAAQQHQQSNERESAECARPRHYCNNRNKWVVRVGLGRRACARNELLQRDGCRDDRQFCCGNPRRTARFVQPIRTDIHNA